VPPQSYKDQDHHGIPRVVALMVMLVGVTSQHDTESSGSYIHVSGCGTTAESVECGSDTYGWCYAASCIVTVE